MGRGRRAVASGVLLILTLLIGFVLPMPAVSLPRSMVDIDEPEVAPAITARSGRIVTRSSTGSIPPTPASSTR
jgi:hypothetical protein